MSSPGQPYFTPPVSEKVTPEETAIHLRQLYLTINQHDAAIKLVNSNLTDLENETKSASSSSSSSSISSGVSSFNGSTGSVTYFPNLEFVNDQSGNTTYTTQTQDNAAVIILNDASPIAITLNFNVSTNWGTSFLNLGTGTATLTPSQGTISYAGNIGAASMPVPGGSAAMVWFDGTNWRAVLVGNVSGLGTIGFIPEWTGTETLGNSPLDDSITLPNSVTNSKLFNTIAAVVGNFLNAIGLAGAAGEVFDLFGLPGAGAMVSWGAQDPTSGNIFDGTIFLGAYVPDPTTPVGGDDFGGIDYRGLVDNAGHITGSALVLLATINGYYAFQGVQDGGLGIGGTGMVGAVGSPDPQNGVLYIPAAGTPIFNLPFATVVYSVAGTPIIPAATAGAGARAFVSDATVNVFASPYVGGGANSVPVYSDGTAWFVG